VREARVQKRRQQETWKLWLLFLSCARSIELGKSFSRRFIKPVLDCVALKNGFICGQLRNKNLRSSAMNKTMKAALAALIAAGATSVVYLPAQAQVADENTSVTGSAVYVEEEDVDLPLPSGHNGLTISGAVGLPLNPTAQTPAKGSVRVQANYYQLFKDDALINADSKLYGVYVAGGVTDRLEVSAGLEKNSVSGNGAASDIFDKSGVALGVKYLLGKQSNPEDVRFAIGAGYSSALFKNTHVYAVASKGFGAGRRVITGHLGVRWDRFKANGNAVLPGVGSFESSKVSVYGGAELPIDRRGRFTLVGELQSKNTDTEFGGAMPYSLSVRYRSDNGFSASVGMMRQGVLSDIVQDDSGLFAQVGKTF
jgi:hypothetical protein